MIYYWVNFSYWLREEMPLFPLTFYWTPLKKLMFFNSVYHRNIYLYISQLGSFSRGFVKNRETTALLKVRTWYQFFRSQAMSKCFDTISLSLSYQNMFATKMEISGRNLQPWVLSLQKFKRLRSSEKFSANAVKLILITRDRISSWRLQKIKTKDSIHIWRFWKEAGIWTKFFRGRLLVKDRFLRRLFSLFCNEFTMTPGDNPIELDTFKSCESIMLEMAAFDIKTSQTVKILLS